MKKVVSFLVFLVPFCVYAQILPEQIEWGPANAESDSLGILKRDNSTGEYSHGLIRIPTAANNANLVIDAEGADLFFYYNDPAGNRDTTQINFKGMLGAVSGGGGGGGTNVNWYAEGANLYLIKDVDGPTPDTTVIVFTGAVSGGGGTDNQTIDVFSFASGIISLSLENDGQSTQTVDISSVNTDDQNLQNADFNTTTGVLSIGIENGTGITQDLDGRYLTSQSDDQTLSQSIVNDTLQTSIESGNTVKTAISALDKQDLSLTGDILSLTGDATTVNLSAYMDDTDTDDQNLTVGAGAAATALINITDGTGIVIEVISGLSISESGDTIKIDNTVMAEDDDITQVTIDGAGNLEVHEGATVQEMAVSNFISSDASNTLTTGADGKLFTASGTGESTTVTDGARIDFTLTGTAISADIVANSLGTAQIGANGVGSSELAGSAVTSAKIASSAVTTAKLANSAVGSDKLASGAVTAAKIASSAVTTDKINASAVTSTKIAGSAVTTAKIAGSAVTTDKINASAVTADKIPAATINVSHFINDAGYITSGATDDQNLQNADFNTTTGVLSIGIENGTGITQDLDGRYLITEVDGSTTNEAWTIDGDDNNYTEVISNQTVLFHGDGLLYSEYDAPTNTLTYFLTPINNFIGTAGNDPILRNTGDNNGGIQFVGGTGITVNGASGAFTISSSVADEQDLSTGTITGGTSTSMDLLISNGTGVTLQTAGGIRWVTGPTLDLQIADLTAVAPATGDHLILSDVSAGSAERRATIADVLSLATDSDNQTLSFSSPSISISGGNSVDISAIQDGDGIYTGDGSITSDRTVSTGSDSYEMFFQRQTGDYVQLDANANSSKVVLAQNGYQDFIIERVNSNAGKIYTSGVGTVTIDVNGGIGFDDYIFNAEGLNMDGGLIWNVEKIGVSMTSPTWPIEDDSAAHLTDDGVWTDASDRALKKDIKELSYGLGEVLRMKPVSYKYRANNRASIGFIAQDIEKIIPEVVSGKDGRKGIGYGPLVSVLVNAIKDQQSQIEDLKKRVAKLEK